MSDFNIKPIGKPETETRSMELYQVFQPQETAGTEKVAVTRPTAPDETEKPAERPPEQKAQLPVSQSDVVLKFQVNDETKEITVFLVDRASKKVLRSIPPDEVTKLKPGELLRLSA
jgi:uncharacterized FlaG/YvyC family protein